MTNAESHFDDIAEDYDYWKKKNYYYHQNLKDLYKSFIPRGSEVLEIGCGTGDILVSLEPSRGLGIDISKKMIKRAKEKYREHPTVDFECRNIFQASTPFDYEFLVMADVLEHFDAPRLFVAHLARLVKKESALIVSVANPLWEPMLSLAERLHMKMPEGPHTRLSIRENESLFLTSGFSIAEKGYRLLVPRKIPGSDWINARFYQNKVLAPLGCIIYWVLKKI